MFSHVQSISLKNLGVANPFQEASAKAFGMSLISYLFTVGILKVQFFQKSLFILGVFRTPSFFPMFFPTPLFSL